MEKLDLTTSYLLLGTFVVVWIGVGLFISRKNRDSQDFLFAGRGVGMAVASASIVATWITGNTVLAAPEFAYKIGLWGIIGYCMAGFGLLAFAPMALRIKDLFPKGFSSGDFIKLRFGDTAWLVYFIGSIIYLLIFLITQALAGGLLISYLTELSFMTGLIVVTSVCAVYTLAGGMRSVMGLDFVQSIIILSLILIVVVVSYSDVSVGRVYEGIISSPSHTGHLNLLLPAGLIFAWNTFVFGMGEIFHSNVWWVRIFSMRKDTVFKAYIISGLIWLVVPVIVGLVAFIAIAEQLEVAHVNLVFPIVAEKVLGKAGLIVVCFIILASLATTVASLLTTTSIFLSQDIYRRRIKKDATEQDIMQAAKVCIISMAVLAMIAAYFLKDVATLYTILLLSGAFVSAMIWPIVLGLFWKEANPTGAILGMIFGSTVGVIVYFAYATYASAIAGMVVSAITLVLFTKFKPDNFDWNKFKEEHKYARNNSIKRFLSVMFYGSVLWLSVAIGFLLVVFLKEWKNGKVW